MNMLASLSKDSDSTIEIDGDRGTAPRRRLWIGGLLVTAVLLGAIWFFFLRGDDKPAPAPANQPRVTYMVPGRAPVTATINATGTLAARREMPVGVAGEGGMVAAVLVEPGDWVGAGQVLATIERSVQAQQTNQMAAQIGVSEADARIAQADLDRAKKLVARGFVSQADIDRRTATRDAALARVKLSRAQLGEMNARMGRLAIRAPAAGLVLTRAVEPGQIVSAGGQPLFRIAKGGEMEMMAQVSEGDLARLGVGRVAQVTPVGSAASLHGQIWQLSPVINPETRQGFARIALNYDKAIRPGGFASAQIRSGTVDAPLLPESAVQSDAKGNFVYIVGADKKVARRDVTVGDVSDQGITILSGLTGQERVVVSAGAFLNPGDTVVPVRQAARR
ncbi:efflux RND transporter periplasmic adaptor subunit [Sphingomonas sp. 1P06PA]|uniref:efflux RND transporter periplasmic adaptor subunit n=1 Tax=Sphingomonas sp. 1P06PA TaxID=554121 RepID=UPI0039A4BDDE